MILTKGRCDPPFLSQLGFGEGVRGWWVGVLGFLDTRELVGEGGLVAVEIGALEALGILGLAAEGIFVAERVGAIGVLGGLWLGGRRALGAICVLGAFQEICEVSLKQV